MASASNENTGERMDLYVTLVGPYPQISTVTRPVLTCELVTPANLQYIHTPLGTLPVLLYIAFLLNVIHENVLLSGNLI